MPRNRHVLNLYFREICIFDHLSHHKSAAVTPQVQKSMRYDVERLLDIIHQHISHTGDHRLAISRSIIQDFMHSNIRWWAVFGTDQLQQRVPTGRQYYSLSMTRKGTARSWVRSRRRFNDCDLEMFHFGPSTQVSQTMILRKTLRRWYKTFRRSPKYKKWIVLINMKSTSPNMGIKLIALPRNATLSIE